jgi:hypothetical protein
MNITGVLLQTTGVEDITSTFKKTNLIIKTEHDTQYPQEISIEVHNDNIAKLGDGGIKAGDIVSVDCNLRGRKYSKDGQPDKWFNSIIFWRMTKVSDGVATTVASAPVAKAAAPVEELDQSLPF